MAARKARPTLALSLQFARDDTVRVHRQALSRSLVVRCLRAALQRPAEITVRVVGEQEGLSLNRDYRGQDHATNVLTFDYSSQPQVVADLVLCAPVIEREAVAMGIALADHYAHLLVHGVMHAQGYDHLDEAQAQQMEGLETNVLAQLGVADPYATS
ncbi:MAG: rRNA maturation RNase YbeY [Ideonella sp.]